MGLKFPVPVDTFERDPTIYCLLGRSLLIGSSYMSWAFKRILHMLALAKHGRGRLPVSWTMLGFRSKRHACMLEHSTISYSQACKCVCLYMYILSYTYLDTHTRSRRERERGRGSDICIHTHTWCACTPRLICVCLCVVVRTMVGRLVQCCSGLGPGKPSAF